MIRVVIADDHEVVRQGLTFLLTQEPGIEVVAQVADGDAALHAVRSWQPDVLLLDLFMPGVSGLDVLERLAAIVADTAVVVLTSSSDHTDVIRALRLGALSYLLKSAPVDDVVAAVQRAARAESFVTAGVANNLAAAIRADASGNPVDRLTKRERDVLIEIAKGRSNRQAAQALGISEETVKTHVSSVYAKLQVQDRTQAAIIALRQRLVPLD